jgi:hypothetical protein
MLLWMDRTPESFVPGFADAESAPYRLPPPGEGRILRWDTPALHAALDARRIAMNLSWTEVGRATGATTGMLTNLGKGGRAAFPGVMRIVAWLGQPAARFVRQVARHEP